MFWGWSCLVRSRAEVKKSRPSCWWAGNALWARVPPRLRRFLRPNRMNTKGWTSLGILKSQGIWFSVLCVKHMQMTKMFWRMLCCILLRIFNTHAGKESRYGTWARTLFWDFVAFARRGIGHGWSQPEIWTEVFEELPKGPRLLQRLLQAYATFAMLGLLGFRALILQRMLCGWRRWAPLLPASLGMSHRPSQPCWRTNQTNLHCSTDRMCSTTGTLASEWTLWAVLWWFCTICAAEALWTSLKSFLLCGGNGAGNSLLATKAIADFSVHVRVQNKWF